MRAVERVIEIYCNAAGVDRVVLRSLSDIEQDFDIAALVLVQPYVRRIDRSLRHTARRATSEVKHENSAHDDGVRGANT